MQYELYKRITVREQDIILFIIESNSLPSVISYIEIFPLDCNSKYIILNNSPTHAIDYSQLGFEDVPTEENLYEIIFDCKLAKEQHLEIKKIDFDKHYLKNEILTEISYNIFYVAKLQTEIYFDNYNKIKTKSDK